MLERLHLGLDIGAVNVKDAVVGNNGEVIYLDQAHILSNPVTAITKLINRLQPRFPFEDFLTAGVTGRGRDFYKGQQGWPAFTSSYAAIAGLRLDYSDVKTIIVIGGQGSLVIGLKGEGQTWRETLSPLCAAGTGRFLEQQAARLGIPIEEFGSIALGWSEDSPRVASRCSVFAKSDLIHLQQKGWPVSAMLAGLSSSVARMIEAQWRDEFVAPIYLLGGVAANKGVVRALADILKEEIIVPPNYQYREAIGAALLSRNTSQRPEDFYPPRNEDSQVFYIPNPLKPVQLSNEWRPKELEPGITEVYLGIDVGSTSTKAVIIDRFGNVLDKEYLMTAGQPLEAVKQVMVALAARVEGKVEVASVGVTGSGRYLVGDFVGADLVRNEITAQVRAAQHIAPQVETIFELGGQDSKFVFLKNGVALDYRMNKACAAGTGSFIDELAEQLGVSTRDGEFARLAFEATQQLGLGEKCAAFMSQAVTAAQNEGVPIRTIIASLSASLVQNYLSKVVGGRPIGECIFLTGAVFYNDAVVSAFKEALPEKKIIVVPVHKEVTGAIGAALLAKEAILKKTPSKFKGFSQVAGETPSLTYFNCRACEHACAISAMTTKRGMFYYGSRCDQFDAKDTSEKKHEKPATPFTTRESLLFENYDPKKGSGPLVGIPRALTAYDMAPMLTGFLNALGVRVRYSSQTTRAIIEQSSRNAHPDSCFPIKLLHGHVAELLKSNPDYIFIPNAIRLGEKTTEADQHFACPLVQAAPYIIQSVFGLDGKLLDPIIDFSKGESKVLESFIQIAKRLGFSRKEGKRAIQEGLARQREFEAKLQETGKKLLDELADNPDAIGVVLLSRAYNAQDSGANLGMTEALYKLGVIPIPLDCLPLDSVDISDITDRPYWNYERKILAASKIIAENRQLFGLFLSNFGCGPNSFIQNIVGDIMGNKPLGQLEVDAHAAEAGIITRLEALVDTIKGYWQAGLVPDNDPGRYARRVSGSISKGVNVLIPHMASHAEVVAGAMRHFGVNAQVLPESSEESIALSRDVTGGGECLPFRDSLGELLLAAKENRLPEDARVLMAGAFGPCRLGKYSPELQKILDKLGIPLQVLTTVSDHSYADLGLGKGFELLAWQGIVATDLLQKMLWTTRPYEKSPGQADQAYHNFLNQLVQHMERRQDLEVLVRQAAGVFSELRDGSLPPRPLVGINGEIYVRANRFCNQDLVRLCEAAGLEVEIAPMAEWLKYITLRRTEDAWADRDVGKWLTAQIRNIATTYYERRVTAWADGIIHHQEPGPADLIQASSVYLPSRCGSEAVLSIGSGAIQLEDPRFAGVISVMPHGCMPGGIVASFAEQISRNNNGSKPWISLTFDGFANTVNQQQVASFAEQIRSHRS